MNTTAMPWSRTRRMVSSTFLVCRTPSAAVGSSRKTTRFAQATARAIAIACRCPPDIEPTGSQAAHGGAELVEGGAGLGAHRLVVHEAEQPERGPGA